MDDVTAELAAVEFTSTVETRWEHRGKRGEGGCDDSD